MYITFCLGTHCIWNAVKRRLPQARGCTLGESGWLVFFHYSELKYMNTHQGKLI